MEEIKDRTIKVLMADRNRFKAEAEVGHRIKDSLKQSLLNIITERDALRMQILELREALAGLLHATSDESDRAFARAILSEGKGQE